MKHLVNIVEILCIIFLIHSCISARADSDPNMIYDAPGAGSYTDLPSKQNISDLKAIIRDTRNLYKHTDAAYLHLHKKERNMLKKQLPEHPSLTIFLR